MIYPPMNHAHYLFIFRLELGCLKYSEKGQTKTLLHVQNNNENLVEQFPNLIAGRIWWSM